MIAPIALALAMLLAQDAQGESRPTGLPAKIDWTFNLDAGWGSFGFGNSLYRNPKNPNVPSNLSDQWFEGFVKPALSGTFKLKSSEIYGKLSAVGERTYGSAPIVAGEDVSSFGVDDLAIGWRSNAGAENPDEHPIGISVGRLPYQLGTGMLIWDGSAEGGSRGGYWTNARKAFAFAVVGHVAPGPHKIEGFYLDRDELPENETGSKLAGVNYEFTRDSNTLGATYVRTWADPAVLPHRDGMNVFNVRAHAAALPRYSDVSLAFEYASERNGELIDAHAWTAQGGYLLSRVRWTPKLSYRYAFFQGDNPATPKNEAFDPLFTGFADWGVWWQGEIAGEYVLSNSNLRSHMVRLNLDPTDSIDAGVIVYNFLLDHPPSFGGNVTDKHAAIETDGYVDWNINNNFVVSFVLAFNSPGKAIEQLTGRTKNFTYGMVYMAYSF
ncbi:MAG TPA: alginate export family protein [Vicinamibacterales bacterium]|nr:alginate export family protein [Vicinamibacterales bacterium]